ncbi:MAG: carboxymuconolactone decarboxylase family protein [Chloroflexi bacterium]|nr:carboxymuconolactone decarboxylase family protein [Chloroflexota bacterium]
MHRVLSNLQKRGTRDETAGTLHASPGGAPSGAGQALRRLCGEGQRPRGPGRPDKALITLALDAALSHRDGVKAIARRARAAGASDAEIIEAVGLAMTVAGIPGLIAGLAAFEP